MRERCDRAFAALLEQRRSDGDGYLDDSHFSRHYHTFHSLSELEADLALLEKFDASTLSGAVKEMFDALKVNARHYIVTKHAHDTDTDADKNALIEFRIANKSMLGTAWGAYWKKGEFWLWNKDPAKMKYEQSGSIKMVEEYENSKAIHIPPISFLAHTPVPVCAHPDVPKELHFGKE